MPKAFNKLARKISAEEAKRIECGFKYRLEELLARHYRSEPNLGSDSEPPSNSIGSLDLHSLSQRFLRKEIPLSQYIGYMRSLLPEQYHDLIIAYYFSGEYVIDPETLLADVTVNDSQRSILYQTLALSDRLQDSTALGVVEIGLSRLVRSIFGASGIDRVCSIESFQKLVDPFLATGSPEPITNLLEFNQYVGSVKGDVVEIFGPDLFTVFQQVCDQEIALGPEQIARQIRICRVWGCLDLFVQLALFRAVRDEEILNSDLGAVYVQNELTQETRELFAAWRQDEPLPSDGSHHVAKILKTVCLVRTAVEAGDPQLLRDELLTLYNLDPSSMEWLDWESIYWTFRHAPRLDGLETTFVHLLMGQSYVAKRFPVVAVAEGDGAFESSLRRTVGQISDKSLDTLSEELRKVGGNSRELLMNAMLDADTSAMLSILLQHNPPWAKQFTDARSVAYDIRASALRSDLAQAFARHSLLDRFRAQEIVEEEQTRIRVAYLQGRQLDGLVHIDWQKIATNIDTEFSGPLALVKRMMAEPGLENRKSYLDNVANSLAEDIATIMLVDGPDNIKTTISDTLRHGQLKNRFLIAFDRAITQATNSALDGTNLEVLSVTHAELRWLASLRLELVNKIRDFNSDFLTVWEPARFKLRTVELIRQHLVSIISPRSQAETAVSTFLAQFQDELRVFLSDARNELSKLNQDYISSLSTLASLKEAKNFVIPNSSQSFDKHRFVLALRDHLKEAEQEAKPWIALTDSRTTPEAFYFRDLVQLCLLNHRTESARQLNVDVKVSERRPGEGIVLFRRQPLIKGEFFLMLETAVKNLLANAFGHSGLGLQTRISLELIHSRSRVTLRTRNTVSSPRYRYLQEHHQLIQLRANAKSVAGAGNDKESGLLKVRWAFVRKLSTAPYIQLKLHPRPYVLEILVDGKHSHDTIFEKNTDR